MAVAVMRQAGKVLVVTTSFVKFVGYGQAGKVSKEVEDLQADVVRLEQELADTQQASIDADTAQKEAEVLKQQLAESARQLDAAKAEAAAEILRLQVGHRHLLLTDVFLFGLSSWNDVASMYGRINIKRQQLPHPEMCKTKRNLNCK